MPYIPENNDIQAFCVHIYDKQTDRQTDLKKCRVEIYTKIKLSSFQALECILQTIIYNITEKV